MLSRVSFVLAAVMSMSLAPGWARQPGSSPVVPAPARSATPPVSAPPAAASPAQQIDDAIQRKTLGQFWGAVLVSKGGVTLFSKGYGVANQSLAPMTADSLFDVASVTKCFTAAAILRLEMDGKLSTSDPVWKYVANVPAENQSVTILHLLTHTSGLSQSNVRFPEKDDGAGVASAVMQVRAAFKPGEHWEYSNAGYFALAAIIEKASGETYAQYLRTHLFEPAGMKSSGVMGDPALNAALATDRMGEDGRVRGNAVKWPYSMVWGYCGAGGVVSSANDMLAWDRALRTDAVLNEKARNTYYAAIKNNYACGWECEETPQGRAVSHSGGVAGYTAWYSRWLDQDAVIVVLTNNRNDPRAIEQICRRVLFNDSTTPMRCEVRCGQYALNEYKHFSLPAPFTLGVTPGESGAVTIRVNDPNKAQPMITLALNGANAAGILASLGAAIDSKPAGAAIPAPVCEIALMPYTLPGDGVMVFEGDDVTCVVVPSMGESGPNGESYEDKRITLMLSDRPNMMLPVMLRMDLPMARSLKDDLVKATNKR